MRVKMPDKKYDLNYWKGDGARQLSNLIAYHTDIAAQADIRRRPGEQALEELTIKALQCLQEVK